jgi:tRNA A37 threonylcarbamoyladenosine synthetase subunit TsaC/SUA5/YrdC
MHHRSIARDAPASLAMILDPTPEAIARAVAELEQGRCIGMPTETVYGLAGHAFNETAVRSIFTLKGRPSTNPLIVSQNIRASRGAYQQAWTLLLFDCRLIP